MEDMDVDIFSEDVGIERFSFFHAVGLAATMAATRQETPPPPPPPKE